MKRLTPEHMRKEINFYFKIGEIQTCYFHQQLQSPPIREHVANY